LPHIIDIGNIGSSNLGYISVAEPGKNIPFDIKRVYWTYFTPDNVERGHHAHRKLQQVIIAASGKIYINTETASGEKNEFCLLTPSQGLYIPKMVWRDIRFSEGAVLLSLASMPYLPEDYIRSYDDFKKLCMDIK